ncbi:MAG: MFS transporter, partial [Lachnospiraceae bacterium]|nr:MFS transporter [Lachnospiraceae bacterium]
YWGCVACFLGFAGCFFLDCGMESSVLSLVIAAYQLLALGGGFFWGGLCDRLETNRKIFIPVFAGYLVCMSLTYYFGTRNLPLACVMYFAAGFLIASMGTNLDVWILRTVHYDPDYFGVIRGIGSMGWAVAVLICGFFIDAYGYGVMVISSLILAAATYVFVFILKEPPYVREKRTRVRARDLAGNRNYVFLIVVILLCGMAISPVGNLQAVFLQEVGGDVGMLGIDSFVGVTFQGLFIIISGKLERLSAHLRMVLMCALLAAELTVTGLAQSPFLIIMGMVFANVSYGIMMPTMRELVTRYVPEHLRNTAHSLSDLIFGSLSAIISLIYSSALIHSFGMKSIVIVGLFIIAVPMLLTLKKDSFR